MKPLIYKTIIALAAVLLTACDSIPESGPLTDGVATTAPAAWLAYCGRHKEDTGCR